MEIGFTPETFYLLLSLFALASVAGFLAGLLGIGGGIVLVPGLYYLFEILGYDSDSLMHVAVGTSLATIVATGFASARAHYKKGSVRFDLVKKIGGGIVVGVGVGTFIASESSGATLQIVFATALFIFAALMQINPEKFQLFKEMPGQPWPSLAGIVIGVISTLMGIGGATLNVPYMTLNNVPIHKAVGSAAAMGLLIAIPGTLGFLFIGSNVSDSLPPYSAGYINLAALAVIVPVTVLFAPLGVHAAHLASTKMLRRIFSVFIIIVAAKMLFEVLSAGA